MLNFSRPSVPTLKWFTVPFAYSDPVIKVFFKCAKNAAPVTLGLFARHPWWYVERSTAIGRRENVKSDSDLFHLTWIACYGEEVYISRFGEDPGVVQVPFGMARPFVQKLREFARAVRGFVEDFVVKRVEQLDFFVIGRSCEESALRLSSCGAFYPVQLTSAEEARHG